MEKTMKIRINNNNFADWCEGKRTVDLWLQENKDDNTDTLHIEVNVVDEIANLIYFFPISDAAREYGVTSEMNISIDIDKQKESKRYNKILFGVRQFLYVQTHGNQFSRITLNGRAIGNQTRFGNIQPLIMVSNRMADFDYKDIYSYTKKEEYAILDKLKTLLVTYSTSKAISGEDWDTLYGIISSDLGNRYIGQEAIDDLLGNWERNKKVTLGKLFYISDGYKLKQIYINLCLSNIVYIIENFTGFQAKSKNVGAISKKTLAEELIDFFLKKITGIPLFAQYLWTLFMRYAMDAKLGLSLFDKESAVFLKLFCDIALVNATSYADGMYQIIENACLHSKSQCAYFYIRVYQTGKSSNRMDKIKNLEVLERLEQKYKGMKLNENPYCYFEIVIVDNAIDKSGLMGMVDHYNACHKKKVDNLEQLFTRIPAEKEDLLIHYGLRVFERAVVMNGGFLVFTPSTDSPEGGYRYTNYKLKSKKSSGLGNEMPYYSGSIYNILFPLEEIQSPEGSVQGSAKGEHIFDISEILVNYVPYKVEIESSGDFCGIEQKMQKTDDMSKKLNDKIADVSDIHKRILCIRLIDGQYYDIELLAKAIMRYSIDNNENNNKIAILLDDKFQINEFVRIYTAFFDKSGQNYKKFKLKNTQIAICKKSDDNIPEVCFILNGNNMNIARETARNYLYYNFKSCVEFMPLTSYLTSLFYSENTDVASGENQEIRIFPFDLYLDVDFDEEYDNEKSEASEENIWFFRYIKDLLDKNMQKEAYGCKLENVHISLGSKIHIDTFYNAELLLHNYAILLRLAYIIARELLKEYFENAVMVQKKKIQLVTYGEYSLLLIQTVRDIMQKGFNNRNTGVEVEYMSFLSHSDERSTKEDDLWPEFSHFIDLYKEKIRNQVGCKIEEYKFHIVLPINTTLTTIRKLQSIMGQICLKKDVDAELFFGKNISLIVVGGLEEFEEKKQGIETGYWESVEERQKLITLGRFDKQEVENQLSRQTRYYFYARCHWYKVMDNKCMLCNLCEEDKGKFRSLISIDKASTLPKAIFVRESKTGEHKEENGTKKTDGKTNENTNRISDLRGFVRYSHIRDEYNHFKFDIDYRGFSNNEAVRDKIQKWLMKDVKNKIDVNAFNIIVSPLNVTNSSFLRQVIEGVFESNIRLLNIPINTALREEIHTKFSYITEEYVRMKEIMGKAKIHVYFVDDCITQGTTLQRGSKFIRMFFAENGIQDDIIELYKGIIVIANRSSDETIRNLIPGHVKDGFFSYMRLNVPLFNTYNGVCPSCLLAQQYHLMHKRASTHMIAKEYERLYKKHTVKEISEYNSWLDKQITNNDSYFRRFRQWLYYAVYSYKDKYVDILGNVHDIDIDHLGAEGMPLSLNVHLQKLFSAETVEKLRDYYTENLEDLSKIIKQRVIKDKDYMRMYCTHKIFMMLEEEIRYEEYDEFESITRQKFLNLLKGKLNEIGDQFDEIETQFRYSTKTKMYVKAEWLISYLKIASRKQPSQYYHMKNVLYNIMIEIADVLIKDHVEPSEDIRFLTDMCKITKEDRSDRSIMPDMKYNIFLTIIRRLSAMHSSYVIKNTDQIIEYYNKCHDQYYGSGDYVHFYVSREDCSLYERLVEFPDAGMFDLTLAKLIKWSAMSGYDESKCFIIEQGYIKYIDSCPASMKIAFLENTQTIYSGIRRLAKGCLEKYDNINKVREYVEEIYLNAYEDIEKSQLFEMNENKLFFQFMDYRRHYKGGHDEQITEIYTQMVVFFLTLQELEKRETLLDSPYPYETVCNCMRDIVEYDQCRIVSRKEHRILTVASSDIDEKYIERDLENSSIDIILKEYENISEKNDFDNIVQKFVLKNEDGKKGEIIVISLPITGHDMPNLYIFIYRGVIPTNIRKDSLNKQPLSTKEMWDVRNILFLRDTFEAMLQRDIVSLRDMVYSYGYVKKISEGDKVRILHISDLHVTKEKADNNKKIISAKLSVKNPDLILITGDVITGKYSGRQITEAYESAQSVIIMLVKYIWGFETKIDHKKKIRADWKKRIMISLGNHDYASMNELEAQNKMRMTTSGEPAAISNVMVKHSYFVHFIHDLLGTDIDDLVRYDLNRIINYTQLNITIVNLNSNCNVNPLRTNKVAINAEAVKEMFLHSHVSNTIVYMMHHTPMYHIDYVDDVYHLTKKEVCDAIQHKAKKGGGFTANDIFEANTIWIQLIKSLSENFQNKVGGLNAEKQKNLMKDILYDIYKMDKVGFIKNNLDDFCYYIDSQHPELDDRCMKIVDSIKNKINASEIDMNQYAKVMHDHFKNVQEELGDKLRYFILGGHTHCAAKYKGTTVRAMTNCKGIYEAGKFFSHDGKLIYSILQIGEESTYDFFGENAQEKGSEIELMKKIVEIDERKDDE